MASPEAQKFDTAYRELASCVSELQSGTPETVETLAATVLRARAAHGVCAARIAAVRRQIDATLAAPPASDGDDEAF